MRRIYALKKTAGHLRNLIHQHEEQYARVRSAAFEVAHASCLHVRRKLLREIIYKNKKKMRINNAEASCLRSAASSSESQR
jgi:hypothetical protein